MPLEPGGEALVQLGARRLRQRRRRRRRGSGGDGSGRRRRRRAASGRAERAPCGRAPSASSARRARRARAPRRRRGGRSCPRPRRARARRARDGSSWSRRAASSAWMVGGTTTSPFGDSATIASICSTKSGLPSAASRIRARSGSASSTSPSSRSISSSVSSAVSGSSRTVVALSLPPAQVGRRSSSSGRAMQRSRIGASRLQSATCSTRSRNVGSAQWRSSKTQTTGARLLEQLAERPGDLVCRRRLLRLAEQRGDRAGGARVGRPAAELEDDLDDRPVGDPLAVRQAAAPDDRDAGERGEELCGEARLADARRAEDREEVTGALGADALPGIVEGAPLALPADDRDVEAPRELSGHHAEQREGGDAARTFPSARADAPPRARPRRGRAAPSPRRSGPRPAPPPARAAPRR